MADQTVLVRYIARGASQVGAQALAVAKANQTAANSMVKSSQTVSSASRAIGGAAAFAGKAILFGVGAAMAVSAKAAIDFESSMAGVFKTLGDTASVDEINALGDALREMSLRVPVNVNELAGIAAIGGQLGVGIEDMEHFTETVAALAVTTNLSSEDAAKGLARMSNIMELPIARIDELGNVLVDLGNHFATSESEILNFALRLAPVAKTVGISSAEVLGLAAAFSQLGIPAERGGTAIQRTFIDIAKAVDQGGPKLAKFAEVAGMTIEQFSSLGATDQFTAFIAGLRRIQIEGGSAFKALEDLGISQQRTIQVLLAAAGAGDQFTEAIDQANIAVTEAKALEEEAAKRYGTTASQIQLMANNFNDLRIEIGGPLISAVQKLVGYMADLFATMKDNHGALKLMGIALLAILGVKGLLAMAIGVAKVAAALKAMKVAMLALGTSGSAITAVQGLTLAMGALTPIIAAVVLAGGAFLAWQTRARQKARELRDAVEEVNDALSAGENPTDAWRKVLDDTLSPQSIDALHRMGISVGEMARSLAKAPDARPWAELIGIFDEGIPLMDLDKQTQAIFDEMDENGRDFFGSAENWRKSLSNEVYVGMVTDRLNLQNDFEDIQELGVTAEKEHQRRLSEATIDGTEDRAKILSDALEENRAQILGEGPTVFEDFLDTDELLDNWADFRDGASEIMGDMSEDVAEAFGDIRDNILDSVSYWDEYEGAVEINTKKVLANLRAQMTDLQEWNETLQLLGDMGASGDVIQFLEGADLGTKAGLTALLKSNPEQFALLIEGYEEFFDDVNRVAEEKFDMFGIVNKAMDEAVFAIAQGATEVDIGDANPFEAFQKTMMERIKMLGPEGRVAMINSLQAMADSGVLGIMFGVGQNIIQAMLDGIRAERGNISNTLTGVTNQIQRVTKGGLGITSPSKVFMDIGHQVAEGYRIGMQSGFDNLGPDMFRKHVGGFRQAAMGVPNQVASSSVSNNQATTVVIQDSKHRDLRSDISAGLIAGGVTRQVETLVKR